MGRDGARTPMPCEAEAPHCGFSDVEPWLPIPAEHRELAPDRQSALPASALNRMRRFLQWRKAQPVLRLGDLRLLELEGPALVFERAHDERKRDADHLLPLLI